MRSDLEATADNAARLALELGAMRARLVAAEAALTDANAELQIAQSIRDGGYEAVRLARIAQGRAEDRLAVVEAQIADANKRTLRLDGGHCHAPEGERQHTLTGGCWCHPFTLRLDGGDVIIDHNGEARPGCRVDKPDRDDWTLACVDCGVPTKISDRCMPCATRAHWATKKADAR